MPHVGTYPIDLAGAGSRDRALSLAGLVRTHDIVVRYLLLRAESGAEVWLRTSKMYSTSDCCPSSQVPEQRMPRAKQPRLHTATSPTAEKLTKSNLQLPALALAVTMMAVMYGSRSCYSGLQTGRTGGGNGRDDGGYGTDDE